MILRISQLKLKLDDPLPLAVHAARVLRCAEGEILSLAVRKKSIDARDKADIRIVWTIDVAVARAPKALPAHCEVAPEEKPRILPSPRAFGRRPVVVGLGPAGLFAALTLSRAGLRPIVLERGKRVDERQADVGAFWAGGALNPESNVQFGEGGAGTFSDGKLNTGIKDVRCREVLQTLHRAGAPEEILYQARPHVGTDHLAVVVKNIREEILSLGGEVRFGARLTDILIEDGRVRGAVAGEIELDTDDLILAVGHSARDTFEMLYRRGVPMTAKPFSIGARVEHPQPLVDRAQYGGSAGHRMLPAAEYKLSERLPNGRAAYTFCMCPGGVVVAASSEAGGVVTNGMSLFARSGENANSALLISITPEDFPGEGPLAGVRFQRMWERAAFELGGGNYRAPAQRVGDFLRGIASADAGDVEPSYRPGVTYANLAHCLPGYAVDGMRAAIAAFDRRLKGFAAPGAVLTGPETRSSSPLRIERDARGESPLRGLYPAGEGAGYAGGILSAAVDGMRAAEAAMDGAIL